jgi:predicted XRE-type DNA-binding protein
MMAVAASWRHYRMRIDAELKQLLVAELCAIWDGWDQYLAASMLGIQQPKVSALRHGRTEGFSCDRLFRLLAGSGYDVEVVLREMPRRFGKPLPQPKVSVRRIDRNGQELARPAPGPVKRCRRPSGEFAMRSFEPRASRSSRRLPRSESYDSRSGIDDI